MSQWSSSWLAFSLGALLSTMSPGCATGEAPPVQDARKEPPKAAEGHRSRAAEVEPADLSPGVRYVVELGAMRDGAGAEEAQRMLQEATRSHARSLPEVAVVDAGGALSQKAAERHLPVITLDGLVTLTETSGSGGLKVRAQVEFSVRRDHVLKAVLTGAATAEGTGPTVSENGRRTLQGGAIDGAVQVALRDADRGLTVAAK